MPVGSFRRPVTLRASPRRLRIRGHVSELDLRINLRAAACNDTNSVAHVRHQAAMSTDDVFHASNHRIGSVVDEATLMKAPDRRQAEADEWRLMGGMPADRGGNPTDNGLPRIAHPMSFWALLATIAVRRQEGARLRSRPACQARLWKCIPHPTIRCDSQHGNQLTPPSSAFSILSQKDPCGAS